MLCTRCGEKPQRASGLCHRCYIKQWRKTEKAKTYRKGLVFKEGRKRYDRKRWEERPEIVRAYLRRRNYRRKSAIGNYTEDQLIARAAFYGWRCYLCGCDWAALSSWDKTWDHVIPLSRGGTNWPSNMRPACRKCNTCKSNLVS